MASRNPERLPPHPGKPEASELIARIGHSDPDEIMPPEGDALEPEQIAILHEWIAPSPEADRYTLIRQPPFPRPPVFANRRRSESYGGQEATTGRPIRPHACLRGLPPKANS
jgi:hypothetical protein